MGSCAGQQRFPKAHNREIFMSNNILIVGLDGSAAGDRALEFARTQARQIGDCAIAICYVVAKKRGAMQVVVGRVGARGLKDRLFGGVTGRLVAVSSVPVTIIP